MISEYENIILYHHENIDGSGFFSKKGSEIPLFSQIISLADFFELNYDGDQSRSVLVSRVIEQVDIKFSKKMINVFKQIIQEECFWLNLEDIFILDAVKEENLDFPSQMLVALDIYQALREKRPYRDSLNHQEAMLILNRMAGEGKLNAGVTEDIDKIFE